MEPESVPLGTFAKKPGCTPKYTVYLFQEAFGITILEDLTQHRAARAQRLLILDVVLEAGLSGVEHFQAVFKRSSGVTPKRYWTIHQSA